jgi:hypothetical protein
MHHSESVQAPPDLCSSAVDQPKDILHHKQGLWLSTVTSFPATYHIWCIANFGSMGGNACPSDGPALNTCPSAFSTRKQAIHSTVWNGLLQWVQHTKSPDATHGSWCQGLSQGSMAQVVMPLAACTGYQQPGSARMQHCWPCCLASYLHQGSTASGPACTLTP